MHKNDGGPAYPVWELNGAGEPEMTCEGMSLRDYFAAKAMQARIPYKQNWVGLAKDSYEIADAMLAAGEVK